MIAILVMLLVWLSAASQALLSADQPIRTLDDAIHHFAELLRPRGRACSALEKNTNRRTIPWIDGRICEMLLRYSTIPVEITLCEPAESNTMKLEYSFFNPTDAARLETYFQETINALRKGWALDPSSLLTGGRLDLHRKGVREKDPLCEAALLQFLIAFFNLTSCMDCSSTWASARKQDCTLQLKVDGDALGKLATVFGISELNLTPRLATFVSAPSR